MKAISQKSQEYPTQGAAREELSGTEGTDLSREPPWPGKWELAGTVFTTSSVGIWEGGGDGTGKTMFFAFVRELTMDENSHTNHETAMWESSDTHI